MWFNMLPAAGSAARQAAPAMIAVVCLVCPGGRRRWDRVAWRGLWAHGPVYRGRGATGPGRLGYSTARNRHNPG